MTGTIIEVLPMQQGVSKSGSNWSKQEYVMQYGDQYPKKFFFTAMNSRITEFNIQKGETVDVYFDVDAHEWNGRWFNEFRAWKVARGNGGAQ